MQDGGWRGECDCGWWVACRPKTCRVCVGYIGKSRAVIWKQTHHHEIDGCRRSRSVAAWLSPGRAVRRPRRRTSRRAAYRNSKSRYRARNITECVVEAKSKRLGGCVASSWVQSGATKTLSCGSSVYRAEHALTSPSEQLRGARSAAFRTAPLCLGPNCN